jgi:iron-sulfur cluster repair protein YtfE (RIC family)
LNVLSPQDSVTNVPRNLGVKQLSSRLANITITEASSQDWQTLPLKKIINGLIIKYNILDFIRITSVSTSNVNVEDKIQSIGTLFN